MSKYYAFLSSLFAIALCVCASVAGAAPPELPKFPDVPAPAAKPVQPATNELRLYAIDCGWFDFKNMGPYSDTGEYDGKPGRFAVPCFLIHHPKGWLIWDTGLGDRIAVNPQGVDSEDGSEHQSVPVTLVSQLQSLGLKPKDIDFVAFSHLHADHTGNANLFAGTATWIMNKKELDWATTDTPPIGVEPDLISGYKNSKIDTIDGDYDVFGDGSVLILKAPGHTPGHQVLALKLKKAGPVILSGDLYHLKESRTNRRIPSFNFSRAETLASFDRIEKIAANVHAHVVVQHDPRDFAALPKFPAYLD